MADILMLWDNPVLFEKLFVEYGIQYQRISPVSIGTPFIPLCKCILIPTGFANTDYTSIEKNIVKNKNKIQKFVENGGTLVIFGPMIPEYEYEWLPLKLKYTQEQNSTAIKKITDDICIVESDDIEYDGYFSYTDEKILITDIHDRPLMITKNVGLGKIIACSIHELPSKDFLYSIIQSSKLCKI